MINKIKGQRLYRFLFITHEASRTGAPIVLLEYLRWIKTNRINWHLSVLSLNKGTLSEDFRELADEYFEFSRGRRKSRFLNILGKDGTNENGKIIRKLCQTGFDIIYANSVVSIPMACKINSYGMKTKIVAHVHEMETVIKLVLPNFKDYLEQIDKYIAASNKVRDNLKVNHKVRDSDIAVLYEFVQPPGKIQTFDKDQFLVGSCGTVHWRKGSDIFLHVANYIKKVYPELNLKFYWAGAMSKTEELIMKADLEKTGLDGMVYFIGEKEDLNDYLCALDIFLLPSREDPFPLVAIEAAQRGKPIICFEKATGTSEILNKGGGRIVPYLNIQEMAEAIVFFYENRQALVSEGEIAQQAFSIFTPEIMGEKYSNYIEQLLK